jgi:hypothetical protein
MYVARGVLVVEEGLKALERALQLRNFKVFTVSANPTDEQMANLLTHRVLVTENSEDLMEPAVVHEFCVIDTGHATKNPETVADIISREWLAGSLRARQPYLARINADGSVTVREIEE